VTDLDPAIIYGYASDLLKEDLGRGDITTRALVRPSVRARGRFLAKQDFILCGLEVAEAVFASLDVNIGLESRAYDGDSIKQGSEFANIEGPAWVILAGERTALNILQRMSAVATLTKSFVEAIAGTPARIVDTRKTTPGIRLLEKYAVTVGGGHNHRFGLDDGILIKDNHVALAGGVRRAVESARESATHLMKIEVEVRDEEQVREALAARAEVIMLDNMLTDQIRDAVRLIREQAPDTIIEASGGITLVNVRQIAECGVDLISVGAITHSASSVDISLKLTPVR
jgi:nicotinate-nucleotide pyrophosphorylase (carboxylating)